MRPERYRRLKTVLERRQPDLTVLMERVHKAHNFSAILRNCDAAGVLEAHAIPPEGGLDLHRTSSAGTHKWVGVRRHQDLEGAVATLRDEGFQILAAQPDPEAADYRTLDFTGPTCILVGAELDGLSEDAISAADRLVSLPMMGMVRSLNVSVATALLLYEALRQREAAGAFRGMKLDSERARRILFEWAYPRLAREHRERGEPYPALDDQGSIIPA